MELNKMRVVRELDGKKPIGLAVIFLVFSIILLASPATGLASLTSARPDRSVTSSSTTSTTGFNCTDWDCFPSDGQSLTVASNGTMQVRQSNTACGWTGSYYDSAVR